jgi:hypothetical protein
MSTEHPAAIADWEEELLTAKVAKKIRKGRKADQPHGFALFADLLCEL